MKVTAVLVAVNSILSKTCAIGVRYERREI